MSSLTPPVTVLLTVYNGMPYLPETVQSVLQQSYTDFIFLILNNGSTDGTHVYLDSMHDERLRIMHLPDNIGRTPVLNEALALVTTPLVAVIDADDVAEPSRLAEQVAFMQEHPDITLVGSDVTYINAEGKTIGGEHFPEDHVTLCNQMVIYNQFAHAACCFRAEVVQKLGGYPQKLLYAQDMGLWFALFAAGYLVASIPKPLARIRVHASRATRDVTLKKQREEERLYLAEQYAALPNLSSAARQAGLFRCCLSCLPLGRYPEALHFLRKAFCLNPFLLFINPYLLKRVWITLMKRVGLRRA